MTNQKLNTTTYKTPGIEPKFKVNIEGRGTGKKDGMEQTGAIPEDSESNR